MIKLRKIFVIYVAILTVLSSSIVKSDLINRIEQVLEIEHDEIDEIVNRLTYEQTKQNQNIKFDQKNKEVKISVLNKITAKIVTKILNIDQTKFFGDLGIEIHQCSRTDQGDFVLLTAYGYNNETRPIFHGWLLSSNPSLAMIEHPVYEIIPRSCIVRDAVN